MFESLGQESPCVNAGEDVKGQEVSIDVTEYPLMPVDNVLGILRWMLEN
jgi:hypothetical protein